jgi:hypothetical protein
MSCSTKSVIIGDALGSVAMLAHGRVWQWTSKQYSLTYQYDEKPSCYICHHLLAEKEPLWHLREVHLDSRRFDVKCFCHHCKQMYYALTLHYQNEGGDEAFLLKWLEPIHVMSSVKDLQATFPISWQCLQKYLKTFQYHMFAIEEWTSSSSLPTDSSKNDHFEKKEETQQMLIINFFQEWIDNGILVKDINGKIPLKDLQQMLQKHNLHIGQRNEHLKNAIMTIFHTNATAISFGKRGKLLGFHGWRWTEK